MQFALIIFIPYLIQIEVAYCAKRPQIWENSELFKDDDSVQRIADQAIQLTCIADYPIKWVLPENEQYKNYSNPANDGRLTTICSSGNRGNSTLILTALRWTDTGFYRCVPKNNEYTKPHPILEVDENRIYLFVRDDDPQHLFLHLTGDKILFKRDETSYINCLVTDMNVKVDVDILTDDEQTLKYDNRFGFEVKPFSLNNVVFEPVECKATRDDEIEILSTHDFLLFQIVAIDPISVFSVSISPVDIESQFYLKNSVTIICNATAQFKSCKLETPNALKEEAIWNSGSVSFKINSVDYTDSGSYKCSCNDTMNRWPNRTGFVERKVSVREKKSRITLVRMDNSDPMVNETGTKKFNANVKIFMPKVYSPSKLTVRWNRRYSTVLSNDTITEEVKSSQHFAEFKKVTRKGDEGKSMYYDENPELQFGLLIKNATANLGGDYLLSIHAVDDAVNYSFPLQVVSRQKLQLVVTEENSFVQLDSNYLELSKTYNVWCIAEGSPSQPLSLWYIPCTSSSNHCVDYTFEKFATFQNALVARVVASKTVTYYCKSESKGGNVNAQPLPFVVTDIRDGCGFNVEVEKVTVYQRMNTNITCKMHRHDNYQKPQWYYQPLDNATLIPLQPINGKNFTIQNLIDDYSSKSVLTINNIQKAHTGTYICQSYRTTNSKIVTSNATITVLETVHPWISNLSSAFEEHFTYAHSASILCDAYGEPRPIVRWTKDGVDISSISRHGISFEKDNTELKISRVVNEDSGIYVCIASNFDGRASRRFKRNVGGDFPSYTVGAVACGIGLFIISIAVVIIVHQCLKIKKARLQQQEHLTLSNSRAAITMVTLNERAESQKLLADGKNNSRSTTL